MNRSEALLLAVFGGVMTMLGVLLSGALTQPALAGTADSGAGVVAVTGLASSNQEVLYVFDREAQRLAVYKIDASNRLTLVAARETTFDFKPREFGKQEPSVRELKDAWEKHQEASGLVERGLDRGRR